MAGRDDEFRKKIQATIDNAIRVLVSPDPSKIAIQHAIQR